MESESATALRVLVADDSEDSTMVLAKVLRLLGYEVDVAFNGRQCLDRMQAFKPHCAIVDLCMPHLDGLEVARQARSLNQPHELSLIAMTAQGVEQGREAALSAGFDHFMRKPIDINGLCRLLPHTSGRA